MLINYMSLCRFLKECIYKQIYTFKLKSRRLQFPTNRKIATLLNGKNNNMDVCNCQCGFIKCLQLSQNKTHDFFLIFTASQRI